MSKRARERKAEMRRLRAASRRMVEAYRAKRLPGETAHEQLVRTLRALRDEPHAFIMPATFKYISVGYDPVVQSHS